MSISPTDPIQHVVVLILENHSFDQMLGCLKEVYPDLDGIDPAKPGQNTDASGKAFRQTPTRERQMSLDPHHEVLHVATQLQDRNGGFIKDFENACPHETEDDKKKIEEQKPFIMGYYPLDFLPALHALGREFTVCDRWFSSLPGPTWPNRFFALTGTSNGRVDMPGDGKHTVDLKGWFEQTQPTIFDRLSEKAIHWKVYFHDIPQTSVLLRQRLPENAARYFYIDRFFHDARGLAEDFPEFCLIEPDYMGADENDDHPPHDIMKAQKLLADVYNAVRANEELWRSTLLVVFYDEHGGFYDHVVPPEAVPPDDKQVDYNFKQLGIRVPAFLVSPWAKKGVCHTQFDHTSVLKYLIEKWSLGPLGQRAAAANSIASALQFAGAPRGDTVRRIELTSEQLSPPNPDTEEQAAALVTAHHLSLESIARYIRIEAVEGLPRGFTWTARLIERIKMGCEWALRGIYRERLPMKVSITQPDRISRDKVTLRENVAKFLKHQKEQAVPALAAKIRDPKATAAERKHAVRALASITGRRFQHESDSVDKASLWLQSRGH
ncbi:MAG: Phospholipase [Phycisphaerales bacterium]|nr:Phospholipase [Phycisphaerales bacterium]